MKQNRTAYFHMGVDYARVMLEGQTTDTALVHLYGTSEEIEHYGKLIEKAINDAVAKPPKLISTEHDESGRVVAFFTKESR